MKKTYKREIGFVLLALWVALTVWMFTGIAPVEIVNYEAMYNTITTILLPSALSMFGIDALVKMKKNDGGFD